jgi:hypothetical protein
VEYGDVNRLPDRLQQSITFGEDTPERAEQYLPYVSEVMFIDRAYILDFIEHGTVYPRVKSVLLECSVTRNDMQGLKDVFPRLLCVKSLLGTAEHEQIGTEVFGDIWHPYY